MRLKRKRNGVVNGVVHRFTTPLGVPFERKHALMPRLLHQPPKYWLHKQSGQAAVTINGRRVYLGKYGSPKSHQRYEEALPSGERVLGMSGPPSICESPMSQSHCHSAS